ncbi:MAG: GatB/YqeY domain-containing protein [Patescibacteria group bacterium]|jgi:uncharacterized protein YqeY
MLKSQIEQEVKEALKAGDQTRLSVLRLLLAAIRNEEINKNKELTQEEEIAVVSRQVKQRREAAEAYRKGDRVDLAQKEEVEIEILNNYLPQQLPEEKVREIVQEVIEALPETDKGNFGKVMGAVMARVKGQTDGNTVSRIVKETLG